MKSKIETIDSVSKKFVFKDEEGDKIATLKVTVEFTDLMEDKDVEKLADFFSVTAKTFSLMMDSD